ncbi:MAG: ParA family protein [Ktedonobacteraceae bacterium]
MGKVYAVANQKGGVGKTTTAYNVGSALAEQGEEVLIVDLDQQGSLTLYTGNRPKLLKSGETIYDVLKSYAFATRKIPPQLMASVIRQIRPHLSLVPANGELASFDIEIVSATERERILRRALEPLRERFTIFLDCPPNLGLLVMNALAAADEVLVPLQTDYLAAQGVTQLIETIEYVQDRLNPALVYAGILLTQADERTSHTREIIRQARKDFAGRIHVFDDVIKMSTRLKESPIVGQNIMEYDPEGQAAAAYRRVARELSHA